MHLEINIENWECSPFQMLELFLGTHNTIKQTQYI